MYENDDIILTEYGEIMTFGQALRTHYSIERKATEKETIEFAKEVNRLLKEESDNQAASSYHELPD